MSEPSLSLNYDTTGVEVILQERLELKIRDQSEVLTPWIDWASNADPTAYADYINNYSGRAMTVHVPLTWIDGWPEPDPATNWPEYVTKWSGACVEDVSSGQGGLCFLEDNDVNFLSGETDANTYQAIFWDGTDAVYAQGQDSNVSMMTFRLSASEFETFDAAWSGAQEGTESQDGRCFYKSIESLLVDPADPTLLQSFDYPDCIEQASHDWVCEFFLPSSTAQQERYPAFETPGEVKGYFVSSYFPGQEDQSKMTGSTVIYADDVWTGAASLTTQVALAACAFASVFL